MTYEQSVKFFYDLEKIGWKLDRENARIPPPSGRTTKPIYLRPHRRHDGKGSVTAMLESIVRAAGLRTGMYTSPHLIDLRERICVDREMIGGEALVSLV